MNTDVNEFDGDEDEDETSIEIVDDTPEEDKKYKGKSRQEVLGDDDDEDDDDEARQYSERVQKRIKRLKYDYHEERRAKEEMARERDEAFRFAKRQKEELDKLRKSFKEGTGKYYKSTEERIAAQTLVASRDLREALDSGDSEKAVEAQSKIAALAAEKARFEAQQESSREQEVEVPEEPRQQPQRQERPRPSRNAEDWAERNPWFNRDDRMTAYAFGVHKHLIEREGVKPDTTEYYSAIDKEMRKVFPSYFEDDKTDDDDTPATVVAAPSKTPRKKPRTIRLTQSQANIAKRLGVSPEEYAAELMKDRN